MCVQEPRTHEEITELIRFALLLDDSESDVVAMPPEYFAMLIESPEYDPETNTVYGLRVEPTNALYINTNARITLKNTRNYIRIEPIKSDENT